MLHSSGQPLDPNTRAFAETCLGHDFSRVRVHADTEASESAQAVHALAYTVGRHIVFDTHLLTRRTSAGRKVLAHE